MKLKLILAFASEIVFLILSLLGISSISTYVIAAIATLIIPGVLLLLLIDESEKEIIPLILEGFFVSTLFQSTVPIIYLLLGIPITAVTISLLTFAFCTILILWILKTRKNTKIVATKEDILVLVILSTITISLLIFFYRLPRFLTPDETIYINAARLILSGHGSPPIGEPTRSFIYLVVWGKIIWFSLVAFFIAVSQLPPTYSGLFGLIYLFMLSLSPYLFFDKSEKRLLLVAICITITTPIFINHAGTILNDLALTFYIFMAIASFAHAFTKGATHQLIIKTKNLTKSFLFTIFVTVIKPNILFVAPMWIILLHVFWKFRKHHQRDSITFKFIKITALAPLVYEALIDIPYFFVSRILDDSSLTAFFANFIIVSPISLFVRIWVPPPENPNARTMLSLATIDYFDKFYRFVSPESGGLLIPAVVLIIPLLHILLKKEIKNTNSHQKYNIIFTITVISFWNFYLFTYGMFSPITRYSLWMIPLWIILSVKYINLLIEKNKIISLLTLGFSGAVICGINLIISSEKKGVSIGEYPLTRLYTTPILLLIYIFAILIIIFGLFLEKKCFILFAKKTLLLLDCKWYNRVKRNNHNNFLFGLITILILFSNLYFSYLYIQNSSLYTNHNFKLLSNALNESINQESPLIFANNYLFMRNYIANDILRRGLFLSMPDSNESFSLLLNSAPQGTIFMITNDYDTAWYSYNDRYLTKYADSDIVTPETFDLKKLPNFVLPKRVLYMSFDNATDTYIPDESEYNNSGLNYGVNVVDGYYGRALCFNGTSYVSIKNSTQFDFNTSITISFYALVEEAEPHRGHMIISKGYGYFKGSFSVFVYNTYFYFDLGNVGRLYFSALPYVGSWHHYIFIYNGEKLMAFVDGVLAGVAYGSGAIRKTNIPLELGRDSERGDYFFVGMLDELQISPLALNATDVAKAYFKSYAVKVKHITTSTGNCTIFKLVHTDDKSSKKGNFKLHYMSFSLSVLPNSSVRFNIKIRLTGDNTTVTILASNQRATKVFRLSLHEGDNYFTFMFSPEKYWASFWYYSREIRVIAISQRAVIYNQIISLSDVRPVYTAVLMILLSILAGYLTLLNDSLIHSIYTKLIRFSLKNHKLYKVSPTTNSK